MYIISKLNAKNKKEKIANCKTLIAKTLILCTDACLCEDKLVLAMYQCIAATNILKLLS